MHSIYLGVLRVLNLPLLVQEPVHHHQYLLHLLIHLKEILSGNYVNIEKKYWGEKFSAEKILHFITKNSLFFQYEAHSHNRDVFYTDNYYIIMSDDMLLQEVQG